MSECRIGQICDSSELITGAVPPLPMFTAASGDRRRASEYVSNGQFSECLGLRSDYANTRRLLPVLAVGTIALGVTALWTGFSTTEAEASTGKSEKPGADLSKIGAIVAGVFTAAVGVWGAYEHWQLRQIPLKYAQMNCDEVIRTVRETASEPLANPQRFQGMEECSGVDVWVGLCEPPRRTSGEYERPTEPVVEPVARPYRKGWGDRLGAVAMASVALVGLAWVVGNDLHPAGGGDDHMIPIYWSRFLQSARFVFN